MHDFTTNAGRTRALDRRDHRLVRRLMTALPVGALDDHFLLACSGGSDSTALVELFADARSADKSHGDITVAYVDHGQRPQAATVEAAAVAALAAECNAGFRLLTAGLATGASEGAMREARYAALAQCASSIGANWIATGHTRDDQIETVLMRLFRGAGRLGLAGVPARRGHIVRPLLGITRDQLRRFLERRDRMWCEDASNANDIHARNRLRHRVLPAIAEAFGDSALDGLPERAERWRAEEAFLDCETSRYAAWVLTDAGSGVDLAALAEVPEAIRSRLLRRWLSRASGGSVVGEGRLRELEALAAERGGCEERRIAGVAVLRVYDRLVVASQRDACASEAFLYKVELTRGGRVVGPAGAWFIEVDPAPSASASSASGLQRQSIDIDARRVPDEARLRPAREGDRISLEGVGTRKVRDMMIDRRLARNLRGRWPVWAAGSEILWVPGLAVAAGMEAQEPESRRVRLAWRRLHD